MTPTCKVKQAFCKSDPYSKHFYLFQLSIRLPALFGTVHFYLCSCFPLGYRYFLEQLIFKCYSFPLDCLYFLEQFTVICVPALRQLACIVFGTVRWPIVRIGSNCASRRRLYERKIRTGTRGLFKFYDEFCKIIVNCFASIRNNSEKMCTEATIAWQGY